MRPWLEPKPSIEEALDNAVRTKQALESRLHVKIDTAKAVSAEIGAQKSRIVAGTDRTETVPDPLAPVAFEHRKIPRPPPSPPTRVEQEPSLPLTKDEIASYKIPPCVSNSKNAKGYTLPIEMRISADGRYLKETTVSSGFAEFTDALGVAEQTAKREISARNEIRKRLAKAEAARREQELRQATEELVLLPSKRKASKDDDHQFRDMVRNEVSRDVERSHRRRKGRKHRRDADPDIMNKIALGDPKVIKATTAGVDSRLFNQESGLNTGFHDDDQEDFDVYENPLFSGKVGRSIYGGPKKTPIKFEKAGTGSRNVQ